MAVGLTGPPLLRPVPGIRLGVVAAGLRRPGRPDLVLMALAAGSRAVAVFTRNAFRAAPVRVAQAHLLAASPRYLVINTGMANAGTGEQGQRDAEVSCREVADLGGCRPEAVLPFSTGVIGEPLPMDRLIPGIADAFQCLEVEGWAAAADAIRTTDTVAKGYSEVIEELDGAILTGIAKGSGMIRPDMATMLAFLATDLPATEPVLDAALRRAVERSFNRITVDGDTSTNDAAVLVSTHAGHSEPLKTTDDPRFPALAAAVERACLALAQAIVRDAEGATRFVTLHVSGGRDEAECEQVAFTIAHSPLVKTALFAGDPNWGRILAAVGRAGVEALDLTGVTIHLGEVCIVRGGEPAAEYTEEQGAAVMAQPEVTIRVALGRGDAQATVWTSDLSYDYVRINAEYRS
ncbi:MAG: bifunctional glutamate N-acetyltransferase/amino-acid acetyltransferase ArgJ [Thiohalospira sp.]